ncbi:Chaperone protein dnaJ 49 [Linum perenne]
MECNKEEAVRAMELAEKKMQSGDYAGGRKMALKAQKLYPAIDNVAQLLVVCDVHSSAVNKINGVDIDWYAILQIERFADEAVIRKQYLKLALSLHPDKNKCPGAEAAFKLIGEANRELTDPARRAVFDAKCRGGLVRPVAPKVASSHKETKNIGGGHPNQQAQKQHTGSNPYSQPKQQTFWTCCPSCKVKFQYYSHYLEHTMRCQHCQQTFVAHDAGPVGRQGFDVQGPPGYVAPQSNGLNFTFAGVELRPNGGKSTGVSGTSKMEERKTAGVPNGTHGAGGTVRRTVPKRTARKPSGSSRTDQDHSGDNDESVASKRSREKEEEEEAGVLGNGVDSGNEFELGEQIDCPDAEFNDFGKDRSVNCFNADQIWAVYDELDVMPRFYAQIRKVTSGSKLQVTWLEPCTDTKGNLLTSCGMYVIGEHDELDLLVFSHQIYCNKAKERDQTYVIYPMKGETWAIFKDWDAKWSSEPDKHRPPYSFEFVEILSDFTEDFGLGVAFLGKVEGFVSIFQRASRNDGIVSFCIKPSELGRFSHRIPSRRMTGKEKEGVPAGSFELDPAALPATLFSLNNVIHAQPRNVRYSKEATGYHSYSATGSSQKSWNEWTEKFSGRSLVCGLAAEIPNGARSMNNRSYLSRSGDASAGSSQAKAGLSSSSISSFQARVKFNSTENVELRSPRRSHRDLSKGNDNADVTVTNPPVISVEEDPAETLASSAKPKQALEVEKHDFNKKRTEDRFVVGQIWAIRSNEDQMPKNYALVKKIEHSPFRLHTAVLESSAFSNPTRSYGTFREGRTEILPIVRFSHEMEHVKLLGKNRFEIHPWKDEIWALYNKSSDNGECEIVQVMQRKGETVDAVVLKQLKKFSGFESFYRLPKNRRPKAMEISRFSHQCPAYYHHDVLNGCWELDASSVPSQVILLE